MATVCSIFCAFALNLTFTATDLFLSVKLGFFSELLPFLHLVFLIILTNEGGWLHL